MKVKSLGVLLVLIANQLFGQKPDTLQLTIPEAETYFLQNNLSLIASHYNIDANTALIRQARLWDNPTLLTDQNLYDGKFFRHSTTPSGSLGEVYLQVQQLIRTAGKIKKLTALATTNARISELQFDQVMHNLLFTVHVDLYQTRQLLASIAIYDLEISQVKKLLEAMEAQWKLGNISQKDYLRIQALQVSILQEQTEYKKQLVEVQAELKNLLQLSPGLFVKPVISDSIVPPTRLIMDTLVAAANQYNPDYLLEKTALAYQLQNFKYQEALRSPDLTVGVEYDKANSYVPNFYGLTVSLPLPLINRNQGNIAAAGFNVKMEQTLVTQKEQKLVSDIASALNR